METIKILNLKIVIKYSKNNHKALNLNSIDTML